MTVKQLERMRRATDGIGRGVATPQVGGRRVDDLPATAAKDKR